ARGALAAARLRRAGALALGRARRLGVGGAVRLALDAAGDLAVGLAAAGALRLALDARRRPLALALARRLAARPALGLEGDGLAGRLAVDAHLALGARADLDVAARVEAGLVLGGRGRRGEEGGRDRGS